MSIAIIFFLTCATVGTPSVAPRVLDAFIKNVPICILEFADGVLSVSLFRAIKRSAGHERRKLGNANAVKLVLEDVIDPRLKIGDLPFQPFQKTLGYLAKKNTTLATGVEKLRILVRPEIRWQQV
jgi:hypothetical protein